MENFGKIDYVICSEVMEHVPPPIELAFNNMRELLGEDGVCIFSVPYSLDDETVEHFPNLFDWQIEHLGDGTKRLINTTFKGDRETFDDLCFHKGPEIFDSDGVLIEGSSDSLEMRLFCERRLRQQITKAGLEISDIIDMNIPEFGLIQSEKWSHVMALRRRQM
jgi:SAM-dependent methyltransferase